MWHLAYLLTELSLLISQQIPPQKREVTMLCQLINQSLCSISNLKGILRRPQSSHLPHIPGWSYLHFHRELTNYCCSGRYPGVVLVKILEAPAPTTGSCLSRAHSREGFCPGKGLFPACGTCHLGLKQFGGGWRSSGDQRGSAAPQWGDKVV